MRVVHVFDSPRIAFGPSVRVTCFRGSRLSVTKFPPTDRNCRPDKGEKPTVQGNGLRRPERQIHTDDTSRQLCSKTPAATPGAFKAWASSHRNDCDLQKIYKPTDYSPLPQCSSIPAT